MDRSVNFGRRLTDAEYQSAIIALQEALPPMPTHEQDEATRRAELDLAIDHRLGVDFPIARRERLWSIQLRIEKRRMRLALWLLLPMALRRRAQRLAVDVVSEYARVLNQAELEAFFGSDEARNPALPTRHPA
jgi:hypothetical protein